VTNSAERIVCIDYGRKFIGLAVADFPGITARALDTMKADKADVFLRIKNVLTSEKATRVLIGYPYSDIEGEIHAEIKRFRSQLELHLETTPIDWVDESYSSAEADALIEETGLGRKKKMRAQDSQAAKLVLLRYLRAQS